MRHRIQLHRYYFLYYLLLLTAAIIFLCSFTKREGFLWLNRYHSSAADAFFSLYTNVGDGLFAIAVGLLCYFVFHKRKLGISIVVSFCFTGIVAQVIKPLVQSPRPKTYFSPERFPFFIDDIIHAGYHSFPSGHTITAFAVATVLALECSRHWQYLVLLLLAAMVGFSRIYLSQHFPIDVTAGSLIGVAGALLCEYWLRHLKEEQLQWPRRHR